VLQSAFIAVSIPAAYRAHHEAAASADLAETLSVAVTTLDTLGNELLMGSAPRTARRLLAGVNPDTNQPIIKELVERTRNLTISANQG
jgi:hypothetical protein